MTEVLVDFNDYRDGFWIALVDPEDAVCVGSRVWATDGENRCRATVTGVALGLAWLRPEWETWC